MATCRNLDIVKQGRNLLQLGRVVILREAGLIVDQDFSLVISTNERLEVELVKLGQLWTCGPSRFDGLISE